MKKMVIILVVLLVLASLIIYSLKNYLFGDVSSLFFFPIKEIDYSWVDKSIRTKSDFISSSDNIDSIKLNVVTFNLSNISKGTDELSNFNFFFFHGAGGNIYKYKDFIQPIIERGGTVIALDWQGYGNSTGIPNQENVLNDSRVFAEKYILNSTKKNIVLGVSLGGQIATIISDDFQDKVDALVLFSPMVSYSTLAKDNSPGILKYAVNFENKFHSDFNTLSIIRNIKTPVFLLISNEDNVVPKSRLVNLYKEIKTYNKDYLIVDGGHLEAFENEASSLVINSRLSQFFSLYVK